MAGDQHHYSRYEHRGADDSEIGPTHKITAGGGGAFLHPTHQLPRRATIGITPDRPDDVADYRWWPATPTHAGRAGCRPGRCCWPSATPASWWCRDWRAWPCCGRSSSACGASAPTPARASPTRRRAGTGSTCSAACSATRSPQCSCCWCCSACGPSPRRRRGRPGAGRGWGPRRDLPLVHLAAQVVVLATVALAAVTVAGWVGDGWAFAVVASAVAFALGAVAGATVMGAYLALAVAVPGMHAHANEAFAAARITGYKNFLRMHVGPDGALTVHTIGIDRAVKRRRWRAVPGDGGDPEASWIEPVGAGAPAPADRPGADRLTGAISGPGPPARRWPPRRPGRPPRACGRGCGCGCGRSRSTAPSSRPPPAA